MVPHQTLTLQRYLVRYSFIKAWRAKIDIFAKIARRYTRRYKSHPLEKDTTARAIDEQRVQSRRSLAAACQPPSRCVCHDMTASTRRMLLLLIACLFHGVSGFSTNIIPRRSHATISLNKLGRRFASDDNNELTRGEGAAEADSEGAEVATRETAEEAWAKAPEGSFLSPALLAALFLTSLCIRFFVLGG